MPAPCVGNDRLELVRAALGMAADIDTLPFGPTQLVAQPLALSRTPTRMAVRPPDRGEHTDEILAELGLGDRELAELRGRNII